MLEFSNKYADFRTAKLSNEISTKDVELVNRDTSIEAIHIIGDCNFTSCLKLLSSSATRFHFSDTDSPISDFYAHEALSNATFLFIANSPNAFEGIDHFGCFEKLNQLTVCHQKLYSNCLHWISKRQSLLTLAMHFTDLSDSNLRIATESCFKTLKMLSISNTDVRFQKMSRSPRFEKCLSLDIQNTFVDDLSLFSIVNCFPNLQRIIARRSALSKDGAKLLKTKLKNLKTLVTDYESLNFDFIQQPFCDWTSS